jgi:hypothetical protein
MQYVMLRPDYLTYLPAAALHDLYLVLMTAQNRFSGGQIKVADD